MNRTNNIVTISEYMLRYVNLLHTNNSYLSITLSTTITIFQDFLKNNNLCFFLFMICIHYKYKLYICYIMNNREIMNL